VPAQWLCHFGQGHYNRYFYLLVYLLTSTIHATNDLQRYIKTSCGVSAWLGHGGVTYDRHKDKPEKQQYKIYTKLTVCNEMSKAIKIGQEWRKRSRYSAATHFFRCPSSTVAGRFHLFCDQQLARNKSVGRPSAWQPRLDHPQTLADTMSTAGLRYWQLLTTDTSRLTLNGWPALLQPSGTTTNKANWHRLDLAYTTFILTRLKPRLSTVRL